MLQRAVLVSAAIALCAVASGAQTLAGSPDVALDVVGTVVGPADVTDDLTAVPPAGIDLGPLPDGAEVTAYAPFPGAGELFALEHTLDLPGGVTARPVDVVLWDGATYSIALSGAGTFPDSAGIDALSFVPATSAIWISLDTTAEVVGNLFRDADVFDGALGIVFDASAAGVPAGLDVDAVSAIAGSSDLLLSFDVGGTLGGVTFDDEDVLRYDPVGNTWALELEPALQIPGWETADLDALHLVPEPQQVLGLVAGALLLAGLHRRRAEGRS